jgi:hypothetical protein
MSFFSHWRIGWLVAACGLLNSCGIMLNCHRPFNIYKFPIAQHPHANRPRTDGIFVSTDSRDAYFFYANGRVMSYGFLHPIGDFWSDPDSALATMRAHRNFNSREGWGDHSIRNDTIWVQAFNWNVQEPCTRAVFDDVGRVISDSIIVINVIFAHSRADTLFKGSKEFRFHPTALKPDSANVWFEKKLWYKKELHPSRR